MWILGSIIVGLAVPVRSGILGLDIISMGLGLVGLAILVGIVESTMARFRLIQIPQLLIGACVFTVIGFLIH